MGGPENIGGWRPSASSTSVQRTLRGFRDASRFSFVSTKAPAFVDILPTEAPASVDMLPLDAPASVGSVASGSPPEPDAVASFNSGSVRCSADQWRVYEEIDGEDRKCNHTNVGQGDVQTNDVENDVIDKLYLIGRGSEDAGHRYAFNLFKTLCKCSRSIRLAGSMMLKTHGKRQLIGCNFNDLECFLRALGVGISEKSKLTQTGYFETEMGAC